MKSFLKEKNMKQTKDIVVKENTAALMVLPEDDFSAMPQAEASDYKIPVLTVIQPTSQLEGTPGDVVDSNTKQKLFGANDVINFIPLWFYKDFAVYEAIGDQRGKYLRREDRTPKNIPFEKFDARVQTDPGGQKVMYMVRTCFFVILEKDLSQPMPQIYLLRYKGASLGEGKNAIMCWDRAVRTKIRPYSMVMSVTPKMEKNEKGKYIVLRTANVLENNQAKQLQGSDLQSAYNWHKVIMENREAMADRAGEDVDEAATTVDATATFEDGKLTY
jgi:hypothetical protein